MRTIRVTELLILVMTATAAGLTACGSAAPLPEDNLLNADSAASTVVAPIPVLVTSDLRRPRVDAQPNLTLPSLPHISATREARMAVTWRPLLQSSDDYTGSIAVKFKDGTDVKLDRGTWRDARGNVVAGFENFRAQFLDVGITAVLPISADTWAEIQARAHRERITLHEWPLYFHLRVADSEQAEMLLAYLYAQPNIAWAHPIPRTEPTNIQVPSLNPGENFLLNTSGALNIVAAWNSGLTGAGQTVVDIEHRWIYTHADLPLNLATTPIDAPEAVPVIDPDGALQHGTAVFGIIGAQDNSLGTTGIAPAATLRTAATGTSHAAEVSTLHLLAEKLPIFGLGQNVGGQIATIEIGYGDMPLEGYKEEFDAIHDLVALGTVVVEAAGNETTNLDDPKNVQTSCGAEKCPELWHEDTGAIMVGASQGSNLQKADFSNCGSRVNAFAWGRGVVTTGYGDYGLRSLAIAPDWKFCMPWEWTKPEHQNDIINQVCPKVDGLCTGQKYSVREGGLCPADYIAIPSDNAQTRPDGVHYWLTEVPLPPGMDPNDPNHWYTERFSGTSAATAIIGGVAALLEEYAQQLAAPQLQDWQFAYLDAAQMRQLFELSGTSQADGGCNIGVQPDVGKAMELLKNGTVKPTIAAKGATGYCTNSLSPTCQSACTANPLDPQASCGAVCGYAPGEKICADWCMAKHAAATPSAPFEFATDCPKTYRALAKSMDLDGDGRADLIEWSRNNQWFVDLSSKNPTNSPDGYGAWDLQFTPPAALLEPGRLFPVVQDYNADGKADLALYNADTGRLLIKYTDDALLEGIFGNWESPTEYSNKITNPLWQPASRPEPGDYDGTDTLHGPDAQGHYWIGPNVDFAYVTPNGQWVVDFGKNDASDLGTDEYHLQFLTDAQMDPANGGAPGWAYLPAPVLATDVGYNSPIRFLAATTPDGVTNGESFLALGPLSFFSSGSAITADNQSVAPAMGKGNGAQTAVGHYADCPADCRPYGLKGADGTWTDYDNNNIALTAPTPATGYGDSRCHPIPADYDGDGLDDRAVQCPNGEWRLTYSDHVFPTDASNFRIVTLKTPFQALPGAVYPGGVAYQTIQDIYSKYHFGCAGSKAASCTIDSLNPPIGPYFAECLAFWANPPLSCVKY